MTIASLTYLRTSLLSWYAEVHVYCPVASLCNVYAHTCLGSMGMFPAWVHVVCLISNHILVIHRCFNFTNMLSTDTHLNGCTCLFTFTRSTRHLHMLMLLKYLRDDAFVWCAASTTLYLGYNVCSYKVRALTQLNGAPRIHHTTFVSCLFVFIWLHMGLWKAYTLLLLHFFMLPHASILSLPLCL